VIPSILIDDALAGGGGNPNVKPSDAQQKGETLVKQPDPAPPKEQPPTPPPKQPDPPPPKPPEREPVKKPAETKPDKPLLREVAKPVEPKPTKSGLPDWLKPVTVTEADRKKAAAEAAAREWAATLAARRKAIGTAKQGLQSLREGFQGGTVMEVFGPGGEAYASYDAMVKAVYDDAWQMPHDLTDASATCKVRVTIASNGDVLSAIIVSPSGHGSLDASVRRVLSAVKFVAPFPQGAKEKQRTYTISFNLKSKQGIG
jgi:protein TonB